LSKLINEKIIEIVVEPHQKKERLDTYLTNHVENATRTKIQKLIKAELVTVNGNYEKPNYQVLGNDNIVLKIPISPRPEFIEPEEIPLDIIYEDEFMLVINKPAGMVVHPAFGHHSGTLVNALLHYTSNLSQVREEEGPGIVHRIDKETSGLLLIAKDNWTHAQLAKQFAVHSIHREYWAVAWGHFKHPKGEIVGNITRSKTDRKVYTVSKTEGKFAHTFYEVLEEFEFASLVKLNLKTGRTHQIRVHLASINHPIFGDPTYGGRKINFGGDLAKLKSRVNNLLEIMPRQALHAKTLGFFHPHLNKELFFNSELPADFTELLKKLKS